LHAELEQVLALLLLPSLASAVPSPQFGLNYDVYGRGYHRQQQVARSQQHHGRYPGTETYVGPAEPAPSKNNVALEKIWRKHLLNSAVCETETETVTTQVCETTFEKDCVDDVKQIYKTEYVDDCQTLTVQKCTLEDKDVPDTVCTVDYEEVCTNVTKTSFEFTYRTDCKDVQKEVCSPVHRQRNYNQGYYNGYNLVGRNLQQRQEPDCKVRKLALNCYFVLHFLCSCLVCHSKGVQAHSAEDSHLRGCAQMRAGGAQEVQGHHTHRQGDRLQARG